MLSRVHSYHESPEISGLLYKRRGGFGKMMPNAWQYRLFVISKDGILSYYDTEVPENKDIFENKERGRIDLHAVKFDLLMEQAEGSPTLFSIVIQPEGEEKWKLCAETKEDHARWWKVIEKYKNQTIERNPVNRGSDEYAELATNADVETHLPMSADTSASSTPVSGLVPPNSNAVTAVGKKSNKKRLKLASQTSIISQDWLEWSLVIVIINVCLYGMCCSGGLIHKIIYYLVLHIVVGHSLYLRCFRIQQQQLQVEQLQKQIAEQHKTMVSSDITQHNSSSSSIESSSSSTLLPSTRPHRHTISGMPTDKCMISTAHQGVISTAAAGTGSKYTGGNNSNNNSTYVNDFSLRSSSDDHNIVTTTRGSFSSVGSNAAGDKLAQPSPTTTAAVTATAVSTLTQSNKPTPGFTFVQVSTEPKLSPPHTWCKADHRQFNLRVGPEYNRYHKKAPSSTPLYEPFAVDVFCTKERVDHASTRFQLPDTSHINTHHAFVPPIFVIQIQIPSEPPASIFSSSEDGPGWAIMMYYRITEETCRQLADISTASPAVQLFAEWCEKAPTDAAWRGRFKVVNSCTNLEELGMPSAIVSYNAKPVLIRRTGTIFRGSNYMEFNIHVHKFANLAKQSIYLISSRCGLMFMQIGFVIEGREDKELPETMFACVAVNKPQEDQAEFIFEDDDEEGN